MGILDNWRTSWNLPLPGCQAIRQGSLYLPVQDRGLPLSYLVDVLQPPLALVDLQGHVPHDGEGSSHVPVVTAHRGKGHQRQQDIPGVCHNLTSPREHGKEWENPPRDGIFPSGWSLQSSSMETGMGSPGWPPPSSTGEALQPQGAQLKSILETGWTLLQPLPLGFFWFWNRHLKRVHPEHLPSHSQSSDPMEFALTADLRWANQETIYFFFFFPLHGPVSAVTQSENRLLPGPLRRMISLFKKWCWNQCHWFLPCACFSIPRSCKVHFHWEHRQGQLPQHHHKELLT